MVEVKLASRTCNSVQTALRAYSTPCVGSDVLKQASRLNAEPQ